MLVGSPGLPSPVPVYECSGGSILRRLHDVDESEALIAVHQYRQAGGNVRIVRRGRNNGIRAIHIERSAVYTGDLIQGGNSYQQPTKCGKVWSFRHASLHKRSAA